MHNLLKRKWSDSEESVLQTDRWAEPKFIGPCLPSFAGSSKLAADTTYIYKSKKYKISFYEMAENILESITFIISVSKKKASPEKILAHVDKSVDGKGSWSPEGLYEELNNMIGENVTEFVNGTYKIKPMTTTSPMITTSASLLKTLNMILWEKPYKDLKNLTVF